jgi:predicted MFS family arabinose efflux permease
MQPDRPPAASLGFLSATRLVTNTAYRFVYPFLPAIGRGLGVSLEQAGLLVSVRSIAGVATPAAVAAAGRRGGRTRIIGAGLLLFTAGAALTAATNLYAGAMIGFALIGLGKPVFDVGGHTLIADRTPYRRRARFISIFELTWAMSLLVGAPAAGWLIRRFGWQAPFWVFAGAAAAALIATPRVLGTVPGTPARSMRPTLGRAALMLLVAATLFTFSAEITFVVFGAWLEDRFGFSLLALGGAAMLIALAELAGEGTTLAFADRIGPKRSVAAGLVVSIVGFAALVPASGSLAPGLAVLALGFFGFELTIVSSLPLATEVAPESRAGYLALFTVAFSLARAAGAAAGPALFGWGGLPANAIASVIANLGALTVLLIWVPER